VKVAAAAAVIIIILAVVVVVAAAAAAAAAAAVAYLVNTSNCINYTRNVHTTISPTQPIFIMFKEATCFGFLV
jgi:flagellar basal body-associated protein FliL